MGKSVVIEGFDKSLSNPGTPHHLDTHHMDFSPPGLLTPMDQETKDQWPRIKDS